MSDVTASEAPQELGEHGARLWHDMLALYRLGPGHTALLLEACRLVDRLAKMDGLIVGDSSAWAEVVAGSGFDAPELKLEMSSVVVEARLTATALKGIMTELRQAGAVGAAGDEAQSRGNLLRDGAGVVTSVGSAQGGDVVDFLRARARNRQTSGS